MSLFQYIKHFAEVKSHLSIWGQIGPRLTKMQFSPKLLIQHCWWRLIHSMNGQKNKCINTEINETAVQFSSVDNDMGSLQF